MRHFFEVGEYVRYKNKKFPQMGVVVQVEGDVVSVFFRYPENYTIGVYHNLLETVSFEQYSEYLNEQEEEAKKKKEYKKDNGITLDSRLLDNIIIDYNPNGVYFQSPSNFTDDDVNEIQEAFDATYPVTQLKQHGKWKKALKQAYIDLALSTNDKEWFMELTSDNDE